METLKYGSNSGPLPSLNTGPKSRGGGSRRTKKNEPVSEKRAKLQARLEPLKNRFARPPSTQCSVPGSRGGGRPSIKLSKISLTEKKKRKKQTKDVLKQQEFLFQNVDALMSKLLERLVLERPADVEAFAVAHLASQLGPSAEARYAAALAARRNIMRLQRERASLAAGLRARVRGLVEGRRRAAAAARQAAGENARLWALLAAKLRQAYLLARPGAARPGETLKAAQALSAENARLRSEFKAKLGAHYRATRGTGEVGALQRENARLRTAFRARLGQQLALGAGSGGAGGGAGGGAAALEYQAGLLLRGELAAAAAGAGTGAGAGQGTGYHRLLLGEEGGDGGGLAVQLRQTVRLARGFGEGMDEQGGGGAAAQLEAERAALRAELQRRLQQIEEGGERPARPPGASLADTLKDNAALRAIFAQKLGELQRLQPPPGSSPQSAQRRRHLREQSAQQEKHVTPTAQN